jgi:hypothetical protein
MKTIIKLGLIVPALLSFKAEKISEYKDKGKVCEVYFVEVDTSQSIDTLVSKIPNKI